MEISSLLKKLAIGIGGLFLSTFLPSSISIIVMVGFLIFTFITVFGFIVNKFKDNMVDERVVLNKNELVFLDNNLNKYFKNKDEFVITDNLVLRPLKKQFQGLEKLVIAYNGESIFQFSEFEVDQQELATYLKAALFKYFKDGDLKLHNVVLNSVNESQISNQIYRLSNLVNDFKKEEIKNGVDETISLLKITSKLEEKIDFETNALHRLKDVYLKQLFIIIDKYQNVSKVDSEEYQKLENQLINSITLVNEAVKNINEDLSEDDYIDIETDMVVLESILQQDQKIKD